MMAKKRKGKKSKMPKQYLANGGGGQIIVYNAKRK
jgi:hypothetical protein